MRSVFFDYILWFSGAILQYIELLILFLKKAARNLSKLRKFVFSPEFAVLLFTKPEKRAIMSKEIKKAVTV